MISLETTNLLRSLGDMQLLEVSDALRWSSLASDPMAGPALDAIRGELAMRGNSRKGKGRPRGSGRASQSRLFPSKTDATDSETREQDRADQAVSGG